MTNQDTEIRRLANGSIDTNYYVVRCHYLRSRATHRAIGHALRIVKSIFGIGQNVIAGAAERSLSDAAVAPRNDSHEPTQLSKAA